MAATGLRRRQLAARFSFSTQKQDFVLTIRKHTFFLAALSGLLLASPSLAHADADTDSFSAPVEKLHRTANMSYTVGGKRYTPLKNVGEFTQTGTATWYGKALHGRLTSGGERFDMNKLTAAHPTLPIPSYAKVTNTANGKSVIVRINDRGPFHPSRIIDLSKAAAAKLGFVSQGIAQVKIERIVPKAKKPANKSKK